jgi:hypothetical protein
MTRDHWDVESGPSGNLLLCRKPSPIQGIPLDQYRIMGVCKEEFKEKKEGNKTQKNSDNTSSDNFSLIMKEVFSNGI